MKRRRWWKICRSDRFDQSWIRETIHRHESTIYWSHWRWWSSWRSTRWVKELKLCLFLRIWLWKANLLVKKDCKTKNKIFLFFDDNFDDERSVCYWQVNLGQDFFNIFLSVICGGNFGRTRRDCYVLGNPDIILDQMLESRYGSASLVLDKSTLWVTGIYLY